MHYTCLPCARVIVRQLGEFLLDSWYFGIKTKNSTKNHISILGEALVDLHSPPGAHHRLNHLQPGLSVHYTEKQQSWGGPRDEEPGEPRHGCSCSEHLIHTDYRMSEYALICSLCVKHKSHPPYVIKPHKGVSQIQKKWYLIDNIQQLLLPKINLIKCHI